MNNPTRTALCYWIRSIDVIDVALAIEARRKRERPSRIWEAVKRAGLRLHGYKYIDDARRLRVE